jgi:hypothetical protein
MKTIFHALTWQGFVFGDYSFQLNMLDPETNERVPHYTFAEPVTLRLFVSLDNVVKNNGNVLRSVSAGFFVLASQLI